VTVETKSKDLELWEKWKKSRSEIDLQALLNQVHPLIMREVNRWAAAGSRSLLEAEAKRRAVDAFETYDPKAGAALSTYLVSRLAKISRGVYSSQNVARASETKTLQHAPYHAAVTHLSDQLGRHPTVTELADHLGWSQKRVKEFQQQSMRKEFVESEEHPDATESDELEFIDLMYHGLPPLQQQIFDYTTGYRNAPRLTGAEITKKLGITQGVLSYQKDLLIKHIDEERKKYHGRHH
jgi:DNA-directed RNA polymerase specialized sigma subunit